MSMSSEVNSNKLKEFYTGAFASLGMITMLQPVFTIKTFVMSDRGFPPLSKMYSGYLANASSTMPTQGVVFVTYSQLESYFGGKDNLSDYEKLGISLLAGSAGAPIVTVFERAMTLNQLEKEKEKDGKNVFVELVSKGGAKEALKGLFPAILRESGYAAGIFGLSSLVSTKLEPFFQAPQVLKGIKSVCELFGHNDPKNPENAIRKAHQAVASIGAGAFVGALTTPADRIKTIMQGDKNGSYSMMKTTWNIVKSEGVLGLWKGAGVRGGLVASAIFLTTEFAEVIPDHIPSWMIGEA